MKSPPCGLSPPVLLIRLQVFDSIPGQSLQNGHHSSVPLKSYQQPARRPQFAQKDRSLAFSTTTHISIVCSEARFPPPYQNHGGSQVKASPQLALLSVPMMLIPGL